MQKAAMQAVTAAAGGLVSEIAIDALNNNVEFFTNTPQLAPAAVLMGSAFLLMNADDRLAPALYGAMGIAGAELGRDLVGDLGLGANITQNRIIGDVTNRRDPIRMYAA